VAAAEAKAFAAPAKGTTSGQPDQVQEPDVKKAKVEPESLPVPEGGGLGRKCAVSNGSNIVLTLKTESDTCCEENSTVAQTPQ